MRAEVKTTLSGQVPLWETADGRIYNQSNSILRALGIQYGYYPLNDFRQGWACDFVCDTFDDLGMTGCLMPYIKNETLTTDQEQYIVDQVNRVNKIFEKHLTDNAEWRYIAGNELTIGDFKCLARYHSLVLNKTKKHPLVHQQWQKDFKGYPRLNSYLENASLPFEQYLKERPACII